ncbi:helix-turn-helix transcriptional regulator [Mesobacillus zeae]|uniref:HTH bat-type domain-containing protein n=1 Tax=Mesobacillus zeae TaxID=1917180 RepID=A0A398B6B2_9BACI|nr:helix-turn-helix domain-containing protein [Mesobacillus zeae]RID85639.1 hypothetical protein D1970_08775 [Mesobacillus zeae]
MGPEPISIPEHFTVDWYTNQKAQRKTDAEIAEELFVSYATFAKWKNRIGWKAGAGLKYCGRKVLPVTDRVAELFSNKLKLKDIAMTLGISEPTVRSHLRRAGLKRANP